MNEGSSTGMVILGNSPESADIRYERATLGGYKSNNDRHNCMVDTSRRPLERAIKSDSRMLRKGH